MTVYKTNQNSIPHTDQCPLLFNEGFQKKPWFVVFFKRWTQLNRQLDMKHIHIAYTHVSGCHWEELRVTLINHIPHKQAVGCFSLERNHATLQQWRHYTNPCFVSRDASMQLVEKYCGHKLDAYMSCVTANPGTWQTQCARQQADLAECTQKK